MDGGENTEKDTCPVLQQNNYLDFMCTQQLLLGYVLGETAATFFVHEPGLGSSNVSLFVCLRTLASSSTVELKVALFYALKLHCVHTLALFSLLLLICHL